MLVLPPLPLGQTHPGAAGPLDVFPRLGHGHVGALGVGDSLARLLDLSLVSLVLTLVVLPRLAALPPLLLLLLPLLLLHPSQPRLPPGPPHHAALSIIDECLKSSSYLGCILEITKYKSKSFINRFTISVE